MYSALLDIKRDGLVGGGSESELCQVFIGVWEYFMKNFKNEGEELRTRVTYETTYRFSRLVLSEPLAP